MNTLVLLFRIGNPILMVVGTLGSVLNLLVFTQKTLRNEPCSKYFIAANIINLLHIYGTILSTMFTIGYGSQYSAQTVILCRLSVYLTYLFDCLSSFYLILASIDRTLVTSPNALTRRRSTVRLAHISIASGTLFWMVFQSHILIWTKDFPLGPSTYGCYYSAGSYLIFVVYYNIVVRGFLVPLLMTIFAFWTIKHIRIQRQGQVAPSLGTNQTQAAPRPATFRARDRQFILLLSVDIFVYIFFNLMLTVIIVRDQLTQYQEESIEQRAIEVFVRYIGQFSAQVPLCISCYTNMLVSKSFRQELKKIILFK